MSTATAERTARPVPAPGTREVCQECGEHRGVEGIDQTTRRCTAVTAAAGPALLAAIAEEQARCAGRARALLLKWKKENGYLDLAPVDEATGLPKVKRGEDDPSLPTMTCRVCEQERPVNKFPTKKDGGREDECRACRDVRRKGTRQPKAPKPEPKPTALEETLAAKKAAAKAKRKAPAKRPAKATAATKPKPRTPAKKAQPKKRAGGKKATTSPLPVLADLMKGLSA